MITDTFVRKQIRVTKRELFKFLGVFDEIPLESSEVTAIVDIPASENTEIVFTINYAQKPT